MDNEYFKVIDLEKYETRDINDQHVNGSLTVVWRDWDNIIKDEFKTSSNWNLLVNTTHF